MDIPLQIITYNGFDAGVIWLIVVVVLLLVSSALMSGSETSLFSLSPSDMSKIRSRGSRTDNAILKLLSDQDYLLATILIANNLVNICIVILSNKIIDILYSFPGPAVWEFVLKTIIVTFILLLFGEIMPKISATYAPMRFASLAAMPLTGVKTILRPFAWILVNSSSKINEAVARKKVNISMDELSDAIEITESQSEEERQMLSGIVSFVNRDVEQIMKPRIDIVAIEASTGFDDVRKTIIDSGFSRIPVYEESLDNIIGVLYIRDMLAFINEKDDFAWQKHLRKAFFVPEHKKINDLLGEFQNSKVHLGIVVDEYGSTLGLLSLEDILEEIVGEISDESDIDQPTFYTRIDDHTFVFEGKTHLNDFVRVLGVDEDFFDDVRGDAETLAGLLLEIKHDFLRKGDSLTSHDVRFTVEALDGRRIDKIRVVTNE